MAAISVNPEPPARPSQASTFSAARALWPKGVVASWLSTGRTSPSPGPQCHEPVEHPRSDLAFQAGQRRWP